MQPVVWEPPVALSPQEAAIVRRIHRAKLFVFLRAHRHDLFTAPFQQELAATYRDSPLGRPPVPPAQLALAVLLQAYTGVSDDEVIEATTMDRRWQLVLACLDAEQPPFSKGTLVGFRQRLIAAELDRRLIERTLECYTAEHGVSSSRPLRAALDSSPLWGAGRVEDTYNLLGHAVRKALSVLARQQGRGLAAVAAEAGAERVVTSSLKAALDRNWDEPAARETALAAVLGMVAQVEAWLGSQAHTPAVDAALAVAAQVREQDVAHPGAGGAALRQGVAAERRISVEDGAMRHGRKSRSVRVDGYKRHALLDLDLDLVRAVGLTPANRPEAEATEAILADLAPQAVVLSELHIDRGYLSSTLVRDRADDLAVYCKAWPVRNGSRFTKLAFTLDWEAGTLTCPNRQTLPFRPGATVHFPTETCAACPLRERCTASARGRSVSIHPDERLLAEFRQRQATPAGRAKLRERVAVEHGLAHLGAWQGNRARYLGERKNLFDLRRVAVVHNLHVLARSLAPAA
ncbi:MAG TPA: IS1182 family transposase [Chloroflexota bacterium]|nr:IS1182 family transposase [Chloroflexota bacterium]